MLVRRVVLVGIDVLVWVLKSVREIIAPKLNKNKDNVCDYNFKNFLPFDLVVKKDEFNNLLAEVKEGLVVQRKYSSYGIVVGISEFDVDKNLALKLKVAKVNYVEPGQCKIEEIHADQLHLIYPTLNGTTEYYSTVNQTTENEYYEGFGLDKSKDTKKTIH
jgi:hypothetical protein